MEERTGRKENLRKEQGRSAEPTRLNKLLSEAGVCSRREADRWIEAGRVTVDGHRAEKGMLVQNGQQVCVDGKTVRKEEEMILLAVHKPAGVVCTTEKKWGDQTLEEMVHYPKRVFSMGRLDKDSEGLILMTNQGDLLNKVMRAGNYHEKEYVVTVDKEVTPEFIRRMSEGVFLKELNTKTRPCRVEKAGEKRFRIVLTQGLNRQIRRMCAQFGYRVVRLVRVRIMNIELGDLPSGEYRHLTKREFSALQAGLKNFRNDPGRKDPDAPAKGGKKARSSKKRKTE